MAVPQPGNHHTIPDAYFVTLTSAFDDSALDYCNPILSLRGKAPKRCVLYPEGVGQMAKEGKEELLPFISP